MTKASLRGETKDWNKQKGPFWTWEVHEEKAKDRSSCSVHSPQISDERTFVVWSLFWILDRSLDLVEEENEN